MAMMKLVVVVMIMIHLPGWCYCASSMPKPVGSDLLPVSPQSDQGRLSWWFSWWLWCDVDETDRLQLLHPGDGLMWSSAFTQVHHVKRAALVPDIIIIILMKIIIIIIILVLEVMNVPWGAHWAVSIILAMVERIISIWMLLYPSSSSSWLWLPLPEEGTRLTCQTWGPAW